MPTPRIAFRTDANSEIGTGHFMRCLTLADELHQNGSKIYFISRGLPINLKNMLRMREITLLELTINLNSDDVDELQHSNWLTTSQGRDAAQTIALLGEVKLNWIIVDHYAIDQRWESQLRSLALNILVIDDLADRKHDCDVLLDQNFYSNKHERYLRKVPKNCHMLLGPEFALLRKEFRDRRCLIKPRTGDVKNILVSFGGFDSQNFTTVALKALIKLNWDVHVNVVVGKNHPELREIETLCRSRNFDLHIQTSNMAHLMAQADLAIGAGGTSLWERICMGLPTICMVAADNQKKQITDLQKEGLVDVVEEKKDLIDSVYLRLYKYTNEFNTREISQKLIDMVDGYGAIKVCDLLINGFVQIRLADESDSKNIFAWRNHPFIRKSSISTDEINWNDHNTWFEDKCGKVNSPILIGEIDHKPIGVVRFDIDKDISDVSIYLVPEKSNRGLGTKLLSAAENWLAINRSNVKTVRAFVLCGNEASIKLFARLKYIKTSEADQFKFVKKVWPIF